MVQNKRSSRNKSFLFTLSGDINKNGKVSEVNVIVEVFEDFCSQNGKLYSHEVAFAFMFNNSQAKLNWKILQFLKNLHIEKRINLLDQICTKELSIEDQLKAITREPSEAFNVDEDFAQVLLHHFNFEMDKSQVRKDLFYQYQAFSQDSQNVGFLKYCGWRLLQALSFKKLWFILQCLLLERSVVFAS